MTIEDEDATDPIGDIRADIEGELAGDDDKDDKKPEKGVKAKTGAEEGEEAAAGDEAADGDGEAEADASAEEGESEADKDAKAKDAKPRKRDWKRDRINELTAKNKERDARIAQLEAELAAKNAAAPAADEEGGAEAEGEEADKGKKAASPAKTEAQIRAEVLAEENRKRELADFTAESNAVFDKGIQTFGEDEFEEGIANLNALGLNANIVRVALATDAPERVLYMLGQDPDEAKRVFALPPLKMATAMAKIASSRQRAKVSEAPKPIKPVSGNGDASDELFDANASDAVVDKALKGSLDRIAAKYN